jgi:ubiquinol-cytochrome c reductase cytochrome b subunit
LNGLIRLGDATYAWLDERLGLTGIIKATVLHNIPRSVNWWYVFGSAVLTAFMIQVVTGIFLIMTYVPSPDHAYDSLNYISHHQLLGNVLRGIHYWGASAMVMLIFVHMTAHFLTGSYKYPRELQWLTGSVLLILTLAMAFTGQLLRWNQDAYWAIVVGAEQAARTPIIGKWAAQLLLAGPNVNGQTLTRVYAIHIWLVPAGIITFVSIHLYLVIYKGISEWPVPGKPVDPKTYWAEYQEILHNDGEPFFPVGVWKDAVVSAALIVLIIALAAIAGGSALGLKADPTTPANPAPDWYLIWYFAILALIGISPQGAAITPYVIILLPALAFLALFLFPFANKGERHYSRRPWAVATVLIMAISTAMLLYLGYSEPWKPQLGASGDTVPSLPKYSYAKLPASAQRGAQLMHGEACLTCHTIDSVGASGVTAVGSAGSANSVGGTRGPNLSDVADRLTRDELIYRIARGGGGMPAYGNVITPKELTDLVNYLETRGQGQTPPLNNSVSANSP